MIPRIADPETLAPTDRPDRCPHCEGTGIGRAPEPYRCRRCGGSGLAEDVFEGSYYGCVSIKLGTWRR